MITNNGSSISSKCYTATVVQVSNLWLPSLDTCGALGTERTPTELRCTFRPPIRLICADHGCFELIVRAGRAPAVVHQPVFAVAPMLLGAEVQGVHSEARVH